MGEFVPLSVSPIAVAQTEVDKWGCPHCGYRSFHMSMSCGGSGICSCGECGQGFIMLAEGVTKSQVGLGSGGSTVTSLDGSPPPEDSSDVYPELQPHPREGTPSHGRPDMQIVDGKAIKITDPLDDAGEIFHSRGVGSEYGFCFVCGKEGFPNIAAFVQGKAAGSRVVAMFGDRGGARLDYRKSSPDRVQVKVMACDHHKPSLELLHGLVRDGCITEDIVKTVRAKVD